MDKLKLAGEDIPAALNAHRQAAAVDLLSHIPDQLIRYIAIDRDGSEPAAELLRRRFQGAQLIPVNLPKLGLSDESSPTGCSVSQSSGDSRSGTRTFDLIFSNG
jgi:trans-aconitate methyltransferase